jgi:hypothetical protein
MQAMQELFDPEQVQNYGKGGISKARRLLASAPDAKCIPNVQALRALLPQTAR